MAKWRRDPAPRLRARWRFAPTSAGLADRAAVFTLGDADERTDRRERHRGPRRRPRPRHVAGRLSARTVPDAVRQAPDRLVFTRSPRHHPARWPARESFA